VRNNSVTQSIPINVQNSQSVEIIHIDKTVLVPGQQSDLNFVINNVGNAPLKDLTFSWIIVYRPYYLLVAIIHNIYLILM